MANCLVNTDFFVARGVVIKRDSESLIIENPGCSYASIAEKLSIGRTAVSTRVKKLKEKGIIERSGSNKDGFWKIKY